MKLFNSPAVDDEPDLDNNEGDGLLAGRQDVSSRSRSTKAKLSRAPTACSGWLTVVVQCYIALIGTAILFILTLQGSSQPSTGGMDGDVLMQSFSKDLRYMSLDHQYDHLWQYSNMSTVTVLEPELGTGEQVDAAISMFHQLHCLSSFRTALQNAYEGGSVAFDWRENGHWPHCLDYLRKAILCAADGTLELPKIVDGRRTEVIDGVHDKHVCRSNAALFELQDSS